MEPTAEIRESKKYGVCDLCGVPCVCENPVHEDGELFCGLNPCTEEGGE